MNAAAPGDGCCSDALDGVVRGYFQDAGRRVRLQPGEVLMRQGEANDRLYLVLSGELRACSRGVDGRQFELYTAGPQAFVGVYSFFSSCYRSLLTVTALAACELAYVDAAQFREARHQGVCLGDHFMPVVVTELMHRHERIMQLSLDRERVAERLAQTEKMASLGQMAAGIAHELNNAMAVLQRNSEWLCRSLRDLLCERAAGEYPYLAQGLEQGQALSTRQTRQRERELKRRFGLPDQAARQLAEMGLGDERGRWLAASPARVAAGHLFWRIGTALHDMQAAARHATHVLQSVRELARPLADRGGEQDVNGSIREALMLLSSQLRAVDVRFEPADLPPLRASKGELVQIWANLIRNACEAMAHAQVAHACLCIGTETHAGELRVHVTDNGPGIAAELLPRIFQPNVTTKVGGLSFGLGLGLTIVERLVNDYGGRVTVESEPGRTQFAVSLPRSDVHGGP